MEGRGGCLIVGVRRVGKLHARTFAFIFSEIRQRNGYTRLEICEISRTLIAA